MQQNNQTTSQDEYSSEKRDFEVGQANKPWFNHSLAGNCFGVVRFVSVTKE